MGIDARNTYRSGHKENLNTVSSQQQIEADLSTAMGDCTITSPDALPTAQELFLVVTAVNQRVVDIEGRMRNLEAAFNILFQKTTEIREELRLTREELAAKNQVLALLQQSSSIDYTTILQEAECLETENASNVIGER